ncbi:hypothetical protein SZ63_06285 [Methanoculleus sediminis]|uniref:Uncharacterized protein n=1 Tax=Methanoculleus sediminis TaxID=1550566 RepID=A0A0H1R090_9EURY|nr:hypothetical protein [Methanoculleus sediminis]KLK88605.1 hypothetical protein SZ63_06285 [Methanoculleus sediminis]
MNRNTSMVTLYIGLLGLVTLAFGLADILAWAGMIQSVSIGVLEIAGDDFFRWAWGGAVMVFGGLFMLGSLMSPGTMERSAKAILGAIMVWIIAGTDIFARLCESIPAGEEAPEFFNSVAGFIGGFAPPYSAAVLLLPFTLVIVYFLFNRKSDEA